MRERASKYCDKMSYNDMRQASQSIQEQKEINGAFYRSHRGANAASRGMQGILGSSDYGYIAKGRLPNPK